MSFYYQKKHGCTEDVADACTKHDEKKLRFFKEPCDSKKNKGKMVVDFQSYVANPNIYSSAAAAIVSLPATEYPVASITFKDVQKRSEILLQAILHLEGPAGGGSTAIIRIRRFDGMPLAIQGGDIIYETDGLGVFPDWQLSALHVDKDFDRCEEQVTYVLTIQAAAADVITLVRPITFTGTEYN